LGQQPAGKVAPTGWPYGRAFVRSALDFETAREAVRLIQARGFNREQDVVSDLEKLIADLGR
jgi:hypothetical protein